MLTIKLSKIKDIEQFYNYNYKHYLFDTSQKETVLRIKDKGKYYLCVFCIIEHKRNTAKKIKWLKMINS